jgi:hypothetical protein
VAELKKTQTRHINSHRCARARTHTHTHKLLSIIAYCCITSYSTTVTVARRGVWSAHRALPATVTATVLPPFVGLSTPQPDAQGPPPSTVCRNMLCICSKLISSMSIDVCEFLFHIDMHEYWMHSKQCMYAQSMQKTCNWEKCTNMKNYAHAVNMEPYVSRVRWMYERNMQENNNSKYARNMQLRISYAEYGNKMHTWLCWWRPCIFSFFATLFHFLAIPTIVLLTSDCKI